MKKFIIHRLKSKTMWFGALFFLNALAQAAGYGDFMPSGELSEGTSVATGIIIWLLREWTNKPLKEK